MLTNRRRRTIYDVRCDGVNRSAELATGTQQLAAILVLAVVCTAIAFLVFFALIDEVGPVRATVITYVNPAVAVALGVAFLHEPFTPTIAIGFVLILAGSVLATGRSRPRDAGIPEPDAAVPVPADRLDARAHP